MKTSTVHICTLVLILICYVAAAPAGINKVKRKDTDNIAALKIKLQKLHSLLQELYEDKPTTPKKTTPDVPTETTHHDVPATPSTLTSEDMYHDEEGQEEEELNGLKVGTKTQRITGDVEKGTLSSDEEDSIRKLSKALSHLQSPVYKDQGITEVSSQNKGEQSSTDEDNENDFEEVIRHALTELSNKQRSLHTQERQLTSSKASQDYQNHRSDINTAEYRLMNEIRNAKEHKVSVNELITDLKQKALESRHVRLRELERDLQDLEQKHYL